MSQAVQVTPSILYLDATSVVLSLEKRLPAHENPLSLIPSIIRWDLLGVVHHQHFHRGVLRFQFQAQRFHLAQDRRSLRPPA
jgi:hypothetical protein